MFPKSVEGLTHTSDAFVDFAYDLLEYTIPKYGYFWIKPTIHERKTKKLFQEGFGDVVMLFRERHSRDFNEKFSSINDMECSEDILLYVARFRDKIFQGTVPLMELIAYHAFLLDLGLIFFELEDLELLYSIIDDTVAVFHQYIEKYFTVVGGWFSLYRVAKQYHRFVTDKPKSNPDASAGKEDWTII